MLFSTPAKDSPARGSDSPDVSVAGSPLPDDPHPNDNEEMKSAMAKKTEQLRKMETKVSGEY